MVSKTLQTFCIYNLEAEVLTQTPPLAITSRVNDVSPINNGHTDDLTNEQTNETDPESLSKAFPSQSHQFFRKHLSIVGLSIVLIIQVIYLLSKQSNSSTDNNVSIYIGGPCKDGGPVQLVRNFSCIPHNQTTNWSYRWIQFISSSAVPLWIITIAGNSELQKVKMPETTEVAIMRLHSCHEIQFMMIRWKDREFILWTYLENLKIMHCSINITHPQSRTHSIKHIYTYPSIIPLPHLLPHQSLPRPPYHHFPLPHRPPLPPP